MTLPADPADLAVIKAFVQLVQRRPSCLSCEHFTEDTETCLLAGSRPPARVIAYGCPRYLEGPPF